MGLPKISHPTFKLTLPSTKQEVAFRPFLVKEEKIMLIAQSSEDPADIVRSIKQVVGNCIVTEGIDVNDFTSYDLEYFFIKLRSRSVNNIVTLSYKDREDDQIYDVEVDLEQIEVQGTDINSVIQVDDNISIKLRHPRVSLIDKMGDVESEVDFNFIVSSSCIEAVYNGDEVLYLKDFSDKEVAQFVDELDPQTFEEIQRFVDNMPRIEHVVSYTNSNGKKIEILLSTLQDFFELG